MADIKVIEAIPVVLTEDVDAAQKFLVDKLGFTEGWSWGEPIMYGGAKVGGKSVHLLKGAPAGKGMSVAYIWTEEVDALYARYKEAGVELGEIGDRPYRMRDFSVVLPGGAEITFGSEVK